MLYLDHNATTPLAAPVREAMLTALDLMGNPSSLHRAGREARRALDQARSTMATAFGCTPEEIVFTSSATEANNLALKGFCAGFAATPLHMIVSAIEHDSIRQPARWLAQTQNVDLTEVAPGSAGRIDPEAILKALTPATRLVSLMLANHETGMLQPVAELAVLLRERGIMFHVDAVQAPGRLPVNFSALGCDLLTLSAHKFGGPKGVGCLLVRSGTPLTPLHHGGTQEGALRAGTPNLPGIVGMARAAELAGELVETNRSHLAELEQVFWDELGRESLPIVLNGDWSRKIPGVLNLAMEGIASEDLVVGMDVAGVAISAGSACASGVMEPSPVLTAMRLEPWRIAGGIRISFGVENTLDEARRAAQLLSRLARNLLAQVAAVRAAEKSESGAP